MQDRLAMPVEMPRIAPVRSPATRREEPGAKREEVAAEDEERDGQRAGNDGRTGPELGQRRGEQERSRRRDARAGPEVAASDGGLCLSLVLHLFRHPLARGQSRPSRAVQPQVL